MATVGCLILLKENENVSYLIPFGFSCLPGGSDHLMDIYHFILSVLVVYSATCTNAPFEPVT